MSRASGARQLGDEAQQYLFWLWATRMVAGPGIREVGYETGHFRAFDDVAIRYLKPRPDGLGGYFDEEHVQAKFSVAGGKALSGQLLADPELINAESVSLLQRLQAAVHQAEKEGRRCCFSLWSPWPVEQGSLLDRMLDKCQGALRLELLFEGKTAKSKSGALRKCWADALGIELNDHAELRRILSPLRIAYDPRTLEQIRLHLSDILPLAGLRPIEASNRADAYPLLIQRLQRENRRWFTTAEIIEICRHEGLWLGHAPDDRRVATLGIRTFLRFAGGLEDETDHMICLSELFTDRRIRDQALWDTDVVPKLSTFLGDRLSPGGHYRLHLASLGTVAFAAGYLAEPKLGARFEFAQRGVDGTKIWSTDGELNGDTQWNVQAVDVRPGGKEVAVAISVTHSIANDVQSYVASRLPEVGSLLHVTLPTIGHDALKDGGHAYAVAKNLIQTLVQERQLRTLTGRTHLFWSAPNAFVFMAGQLARPLGPLSLYEFDFEGAGMGRYAASLSLSPGIRLN